VENNVAIFVIVFHFNKATIDVHYVLRSKSEIYISV